MRWRGYWGARLGWRGRLWGEGGEGGSWGRGRGRAGGQIGCRTSPRCARGESGIARGGGGDVQCWWVGARLVIALPEPTVKMLEAAMTYVSMLRGRAC